MRVLVVGENLFSYSPSPPSPLVAPCCRSKGNKSNNFTLGKWRFFCSLTHSGQFSHINPKLSKLFLTLDFSTSDFSTMNFSTPWFKNSGLNSTGLQSSWLKTPGLKLGIEKTRVDMSFNHFSCLHRDVSLHHTKK